MDPSEETRDLRQFFKEQTLRNERAWSAVQADLRAGQAELEVLVRQSAKHNEALGVVLAELRAHRGTLFSILDRLPEPGA